MRELAAILWDWFSGTTSFFAQVGKAVIAAVGLVTLDDVGRVLMMVFVGLQIFFLLRDKWWRERTERAKEQERRRQIDCNGGRRSRL